MLSFISAQNIPQNPNITNEKGRQGKWTILYDQDWKPTENIDNASFFRVAYFENDRPVGLIADFYINKNKEGSFNVELGYFDNDLETLEEVFDMAENKLKEKTLKQQSSSIYL